MKSPVRFARVLLQHYNSGFYDFNSTVTSIINSSIASSTIPSSRTIAGFFALWSFQALVDLASLKTGARLEDFNLVFYNVRTSCWSMIVALIITFLKIKKKKRNSRAGWGPVGSIWNCVPIDRIQWFIISLTGSCTPGTILFNFCWAECALLTLFFLFFTTFFLDFFGINSSS